MPYTTLISANQLQTVMREQTPLRIFDCTFDLMQPQAGQAQYLESHVAGAIYANLDTDLSAQHGAHGVLAAADADKPASGGRHPLPSRERFAAWLGSVGFTNGMQAVVYDRNAANYCGRLWWMLKWAGHHNVAVLDGGLQAWVAAGGPVESGQAPAPLQSNFALAPELLTLVATETVANNLGRPRQTLLDARATARFKGEVEPLDPMAGHIPGALNRPFMHNLGTDGRFKPAEQLRQEFEQLLAGKDPASVVHHCGSGVSAIPNLLAMQIAGLGASGLYAGSWSDWCSDPARPVAQG